VYDRSTIEAIVHGGKKGALNHRIGCCLESRIPSNFRDKAGSANFRPDMLVRLIRVYSSSLVQI